MNNFIFHLSAIYVFTNTFSRGDRSLRMVSCKYATDRKNYAAKSDRKLHFSNVLLQSLRI